MELYNEQLVKETTILKCVFHGTLVVCPTMNRVQVKLEDMSLVSVDKDAHIEVVLYGNNGWFKERVTREKVLETFESNKNWSIFEGLECFVRQ